MRGVFASHHYYIAYSDARTASCNDLVRLLRIVYDEWKAFRWCSFIAESDRIDVRGEDASHSSDFKAKPAKIMGHKSPNHKS